MLTVRQFRYGRDNLAYVVHNRQKALAVDGGAVDAIADFLAEKELALVAITNTHGHGDHTTGNRELVRRTGAPFIDHRKAAQEGCVELGGESLAVLATPGHSMDSVCFYGEGFLLAGDTLFNGTVGNCFSGEMELFFDSIRRLMRLPPATKIYAGHDYVDDSMRFARRIEPDNPFIASFLSGYRADHVVSTLADELRVNPFLRFDAAPVIDLLAARQLPHATPYERWVSLMGIE